MSNWKLITGIVVINIITINMLILHMIFKLIMNFVDNNKEQKFNKE